jgi:cytidine deaminase
LRAGFAPHWILDQQHGMLRLVHAVRPPGEELFIALAGAVGTELEAVSRELQLALRPYDVHADEVSLSAGLRDLPGQAELPEAPYDERVDAYMTAGNTLRERWQRGDSLALLAIPAMRARREAATHPRVAHILRSVKHPDEVETLRTLYSDRFFLVSAYRPRDQRLDAVRRLIEDSTASPDPADWSYLPEHLLERDEREAGDYGQQLRDAFHLADFFIDASDRDRMRPQLQRFVALIFGDGFRTPSREEYGLACAEVAALRSAELGRQVGACLTAPDGEVLALGTNEVPKAGGGLYWEGDSGDAREFHRGSDTNDERKREIADDIVQGLSERGLLSDDALRGDPTTLLDVVMRSRLGALTEFGRAVHAEMAALLDAGRRRASLVGAKLYTTTFPCHNCARHMITAGVSEVIYVAPYAKSQAFRLHEDALVVAASEPPEGKLHLRPFVGAAPRLYPRVFAAGNRKTRSGEVIELDKPRARLIGAETGPAEFRPPTAPYLAREDRALELLAQLLTEPEPDVEDDLATYDE